MKILIVGGGGREHALAWKLANDSRHPQIFCAPGNAGTAELGTNLPINQEDCAGLLEWALANKPDLTVVGPEAPLCAGLVDMFQNAGFRVFGPVRAAAELEGSKEFSKDVMVSAGVPTATAKIFSDYEEALEYGRHQKLPLVVKADGLAAGKGVIICETKEELEEALKKTMVEREFNSAGDRVLIEEYLVGREVSVLGLVDGQNTVLLASAQDYKRVFDDDKGLNTGGMGAFSPSPVETEEFRALIKREVFDRTLDELRRRGIEFKGVLYAGLMLTDNGPKVLEFNCRFGDPETQVIIPRLESDLIPILEACIDGNLDSTMVRWRPEACVCVVMASEGYPGSYKKGVVINGLEKLKDLDNVVVFHAGTRCNGDIVETSGGRVLSVSALGNNLSDAASQAYNGISKLEFDGAHFRKDIAAKPMV
ncbi:MAG: phosphoribosylamine--glycine ligase [Lentisphaerae bacterium]|nr:phosphoribosylamine--glycine ligase [Lentisphaerota bacterium]